MNVDAGLLNISPKLVSLNQPLDLVKIQNSKWLYVLQIVQVIPFCFSLGKHAETVM